MNNKPEIIDFYDIKKINYFDLINKPITTCGSIEFPVKSLRFDLMSSKLKSTTDLFNNKEITHVLPLVMIINLKIKIEPIPITLIMKEDGFRITAKEKYLFSVFAYAVFGTGISCNRENELATFSTKIISKKKEKYNWKAIIEKFYTKNDNEIKKINFMKYKKN